MFKKDFFLPSIAILAVTLLIFFKVFTKGQYPIPADLLVSFYFPYYSGYWEGYNPWTTHKEMLGADSVRQIYVWKEFAANEFKKGKIPLWNPYTFSGQPLLANFQSSVFYPLNLFYFFTDAKNAWLALVMIQPFLGGLFMYLMSRSFKLEKITSFFAATAFMFSSYLITWMENGNVAQSYIWLPLVIWSTNSFFEKYKYRFLLIFLTGLVMSVLAGHPQTAIYVYASAALFWLYKSLENKKLLVKNSLVFTSVVVASILICAIQILPTMQFYKLSPISLPFSTYAFDLGIFPAKNFITFFASDFFGHPANNNFWSSSYGDFTPYFGVIPLVFSLWAIFRLWKEKFVKFSVAVSAFFFLSAVNGPITYLIKTFRIPLVDATTPSRFISISIFFLIILSAMGFQDYLKNVTNKKYIKSFLLFLSPIALLYLGMWALAFAGPKFMQPQDTWQINFAVTKRNLVLPTAMFLSIPTLTILFYFFKTKYETYQLYLKNILITAMFVVMLIGGVYYTNKFLPTAPKNFIFPNHLLFNFLKNDAGLYRFYGGGTAHIDFNFPTHYEVFGAEGYDTLRYERYAQLLASGFDGKVPENYLRSDAVFANEENGYRKRLFDVLGVRFLLDKDDNPKTGADWAYWKFKEENLKGYWQVGKFLAYDRPTVLPRIFLTSNYLVVDDKKIIEKIYDKEFDLKTLLLEKEPEIEIKSQGAEITEPEVLSYEPGEVSIKTNLDYNSLLYISDAHDPDWQVKIDGQKSELLRAHYALMATAVPKGEHTVEFRYKPKSFTKGLVITSISLLSTAVITLLLLKRKKF